MKFEHILQIYWTKGFFFGGKLFYFDQTVGELDANTPGLGSKFNMRLVQRFELTDVVHQKDLVLDDYQTQTNRVITIPLNVIYSQVNTVNNRRPDLYRLNIIRLYLIKSYRGRCHALGKPVRGQRTWSNAWTTYRSNKLLRNFIADTRKFLRENTKEEKKDYKRITKKYAKTKKINPLVKTTKSAKKKSIWF